jgi:hypothetical protein
MIDIRKEIQTALLNIHPRVYAESSPDDATFPYLTYDFQIPSNDGEYTEYGWLDLDGWDMPADGDTTALETIMSSVKILNKAILATADMSISIYLNSQNSLIDDDPRIKRRKYMFELKIIKREGV